jgi:tetratricopeptide (TPR) repeat protein
LVLAALLLAGCAGPVVRDTPEDVATEAPAAAEPDALPASTAGAVDSLVIQAREHYQQANFPAAIAAAERGLRIDRRVPELYLILAQSYFQLAMPQQADAFARQGLRYSEPDSLIAEALQAMCELLASSVPLRF